MTTSDLAEDTAVVPVVEVRNLDIDFGVDGEWVPAVKNLNFAIAPGEVMALVGESGSGKSTASMAILDLLPSNARIRGSIRLRDEELRGISAKRMREIRGAKIAAIFQEPMSALNPVLTIGDQIVETIRLHRGETPRQATARALELLGLVGLPDPEKAFHSYPHQMSGGQKQRAMIAQALSCDPELLIADEPTTALDVTVQAEILDLMHDLRGRVQSAILLITHDMGVVADLADRVLVLKSGETVEHGTVTEILRHPVEPYTRQLLAAVPRLSDAAETGLIGTGDGAGDATPLLRVQSATVTFTKRGKVGEFRAVDEVSFAINEGEVLGVVGESGSGKSTLARVVARLQPLAGGTVEFGGLSSDDHSARTRAQWNRQLGFVFQDPSASLNPRRPIGQSIGEPLYLAKELRGRALDKRVEELLDEVRLPASYRNRFPHELSGGQKQRVGIARALAMRPRLLIADEPTSALDVSVQAVVLSLFKELQQEYGFACMFISHDLAVIDSVSDRILVLRHGELIEQGTGAQILRAPQEEYTRRLIGAVLDPDPSVQKARREVRMSA